MQWAVQPWLIIASDREAFPSLIYTARPPAGLIAQKNRTILFLNRSINQSSLLHPQNRLYTPSVMGVRNGLVNFFKRIEFHQLIKGELLSDSHRPAS